MRAKTEAIAKFARLVLFPLLFYTACFFIYTWPMVLVWGTHFFSYRGGDGLQNEWNLWWIDKAITELHQSFLYTTWLHYPHGTSLVAHTLNPIHGLLFLPLRHIMPAVQVYNLIITVSFATSGLTAFWLSLYLGNRYWPSILAGFAFTFTGYHFAHLGFHMQLLAMEFIPLMVLLWMRFQDRMTTGRAVAAASGVGLLLLTDFYYLMYCAMICLLALVWRMRKVNERWPWQMLLFGGLSAAMVAPVLFALHQLTEQGPLIGAHPATQFSADPLSPLIPGGASYLGRYTESYWTTLSGNYHESSVYLGISVLILAAVGFICRRRAAAFWTVLALVFYILSLGPQLSLFGIARTGSVMPYHWLEVLIPPLRMGGVPSRMMVVTALSCSMLAAMGLSALIQQRRIVAAALLVAMMCIELWPRGIEPSRDDQPRWVKVMHDLPQGAVICLLNDDICLEMYYQTIYDKPMSRGLVARMTFSAEARTEQITSAARHHRWDFLRDKRGFRYIVSPAAGTVPLDLRVAYSDDEAIIYDLGQPQKPTIAQ